MRRSKHGLAIKCACRHRSHSSASGDERSDRAYVYKYKFPKRSNKNCQILCAHCDALKPCRALSADLFWFSRVTGVNALTHFPQLFNDTWACMCVSVCKALAVNPLTRPMCQASVALSHACGFRIFPTQRHVHYNVFVWVRLFRN